MADGREEWLDLWRRNHLLPPFEELLARHELGPYGPRQVPFLALPDLIRSKETERESDWRDIELLEEILDARNFAQATAAVTTIRALSQLRSRRGFRRALTEGKMDQPSIVLQAFRESTSPITRAWLMPAISGEEALPSDSGIIGEVLCGPLRAVALGSNRHLALVEAVRRLYKQAAVAADRADKRKYPGTR